MISAPLPDNEAERLLALVRSGLLDTLPEACFDDLTFLASHICQTPIALISLVDGERQWFKSAVGLDAPQTPRELAFCAHAILGDELIVPDAHADVRFEDNPLVVGDPHVRFYAGTTLRGPEGHALGTLCVIDHKPRELGPQQLEALRALGRQVMDQIALRDLNKRLAAHEGRWRALFNSARDGIMTLDERGVLTSLNPACATLLGQPAEECVGKALTHWLSSYWEVALGTHELWGLRPDGVTWPMELTLIEADLPGGEVMIAAFLRDLSERREVDRLKGEFVSTVSHELRTPLTAIHGSLRMIESGALGEFPAAAGELVQIATRNCDRLLSLVNDLLDLQRLERGQLAMNPAEFDLGALATSVVETVGSLAAAKEVDVSVEAQPNALVLGDADRLAQVLVNLVANAIKFSPSGTRVVVAIKIGEEGEVRAEVRDEGPGIPAEAQDQIFTRFVQLGHQTEREHAGSGLGLAIASTIVEQHAGKIGVVSEGPGSTFWFTIPGALQSNLD